MVQLALIDVTAVALTTYPAQFLVIREFGVPESVEALTFSQRANARNEIIDMRITLRAIVAVRTFRRVNHSEVEIK